MSASCHVPDRHFMAALAHFTQRRRRYDKGIKFDFLTSEQRDS